MPVAPEAWDEPFFREWKAARAREAGSGQPRHITRSRQRSQQAMELLGLRRALPVPALVVVGSKGKGTAVAAASWALRTRLRPAGAQPPRVGTITSPPLRSNRERIRIDGVPLNRQQAAQLAARLDGALAQLPPATTGYLPPSGAFTLAGIDFLLRAGVDVLVVEEGLGGRSDEVSLFDYPVVAATQIFAEHTDVLGGSLRAVAADLLGVVTPATGSLVTHPQQPAEVRDLVHHFAVAVHEVPELGSIATTNMGIGITAAQQLLGAAEDPTTAGVADEVADAQAALHLPGRLSHHDHAGAKWIVDAAISPPGVRAALAYARARLRPGFRVLAGFPDVKDVDACLAELSDVPLTLVGAGTEYLSYTALRRHGTVHSVDAAVAAAASTGADVLVVGTMSFAGAVLEALDAPVGPWW